ncbi:S-layer homology domain-containing protein [Clostridium sp. DFI.5.61]|uniref:S-layer homology domain-containing protein n=2 Tax=Clostridium TaxID=1485 RepID=UPI00210BE5C4|nr:S-layer homology domain-containing protein [Clostridium sp. DFI.5.61]MCB5926839.1 S-layer homology domain-containing protein [bacterium 210820-DFI.5.26]MCQ5160595.1 S-layer homology domain-containing protein [Clostridium sp. DFI.5.61]
MRKLRKPLSWLLAVCMLFSLLPGTALAADPDPAPVADTTTYTDWEDLFGVGGSAYLTTKDIGRIWTDKSVSTQDITLPGPVITGLTNNTVEKEAVADFLVALSGLGSAATIVDRVSVPIDTVLILDMSPKMGDPDAKAEAMLTATESAIRTLMAANPNNRVAVIGYSDYASVLLPLDHYQNGAQADYFNYNPNTIGTGGKVTAYGINSSTNPVENTFDIDRQSSGTDKYTQSGIYLGAQQLLNAGTTVRVGGAQVDRAPQIILLSEGEPKDGDTNITAPPTTNSNNIQKFVVGDGAGSDESRHAQSFAMMMTAAYVKGQVADHYAHDGAFITIGVNPGSADAPNLARLCLNPKGELSSNTHANDFNNYFNEYKTNTSVDIMRYGGGASRTDRVTFNNFPASVTSLAYNDAYYEVTDVDNAEAWKEIFDEIANDIATQAPTSPTETPEGAPGTGGESGFITFTDELGPYMKVVGAPTVLYGDHAVKATTSDNGATYTFTGTVEGNEIYGAADLSDLELTVTPGGDTQTLTWKVPASLIPLRTVTAESATNALGETTHTIQQNQEAYPIRLFYSVDWDETVTFDQDDNDYLIAHSKDGTTSFYSNAWDAAAKDDAQYGTATAVFTPAASNAFYHYTEDTPLYVLVDNVAGGSQKLLTHQEALEHLLQSTVIPERGTVVIDGTTYNIVRAQEAHKGQGAAFFYEHRYYQAQDTGDTGELDADLLTDYHLVLNPRALQGHVVDDAGGLSIKEGSAKLSRVSDGNAAKTGNTTGTAVHYRHPVYNVDDTKVTVHLGNNGLRTEKTPTGTLTVKVNTTTGSSAPSSEPTFTYTLELYNVSPEGTVNGKLDTQKAPVTVKIGDGSETPLNSDGTFQLQPGQTATVSGIPAGTAYQLTETAIAGYEDTYQNSYPGYTTTPQGRVVYDSTGDIAASVTVSHAYDPSQRSFTLTYNGNAVQGSVTNVPSAQPNITGGTQVTLAGGPTHSAVGSVAVAFIGWTDATNKTTTILSANDTAPTTVLSPYTVNADTTLYAAWGYDTDGDGNPDVTEDKRTVTYNANGGTFGSDETKTETVPAQDRYRLNTTAEFKPTHANDNSTKVAFVGWSLTDNDTIYGLNDNYDPSILAATVDVSSEDKTVYAVWGYDTNGDGKPDVQDESYTITASAGANGSITPPTRYVIAGTDAEFTITPDTNYALDTVTIVKQDVGGSTVETKTYPNDGEHNIPGYTSGTLTLSDVRSDYAITVTFASDNDGDGTPDKYDRTLTYDANGGYFGSEGTTEKTETGLNDGDRHTLKSTDEYQPTHAGQDNHQVLFIGWTTDTSAQNEVYERGDALPQTSTRLTISGDMTVYAVWGLDGDDDGKPDVTEDDHHITATAGDNGSINPKEAYVSDGGSVTFTIAPASGYAVDTITIDADEAGEQVLTNNGGSLPTGVAEKWASYTFSNVTEDHTISVTFGLDEDDNGVPDANEPEAAYTLTYHANGGAFDDGKDTLEVKDLSGTYQLRDKAPTHDPVDLDGTSVPVLFIGWMTEGDHETIYSVEDTAPDTVTSVAMDEDKAVWAAWGYDEDGNGEPDVTETQYTVTARVEGEGGSIDPTSKTVNAGEDVEFTIDAKDGYALDTIQVNSKTEYTNDDITAPFEGTWTLENVQEAAEVVVTFGEDENDNGVPDDKEEPEEEQYTVTASSDNEEQGSIDPTEATVDAGDDLPFTIHAEDGCALDYITVNGDVVYSNNDPENAFTGSWTLEDIREDSEVVAYFGADEDEDGVPDEPSYWTIEASAGSGGGIDPEGDVFVPDGGDQRFDFDPDRGYEIDRVRVDGDSERVRSSYTFEEVTENHTIRVTFTETDEGGDDDDDDDDDGGITYLTITATAGEGGSISPDGRVQVAYDRNKSFIIQADEGYELADVLVDGRSVGAVGRYTFEKVHKNHTITAVFTASQKLNGVDRWLNTRDHIAYLSGYPDGTFGPDRNMTRAEVAQMFYALLNDQNVPATVSFSDVPDGAWYADAVETLASLGMFTGYPDGTFHPNSTITRAEFAAAALSFADMAPSARCSFPDVSAQDWFYPYVASAAEYGWIGGYPDGTFRPSGSITRAEVAVIVNHMLGRTPDQSFVDRSLDRLVSFSDLNSSHWAFYPIMEASNSHGHIKAGGSEQWTGINN